MKRINEQTGKPFKLWDRREDGAAFYKYGTKLRKDGTFTELWLDPEKLAANLARSQAKRKQNYKRDETRRPRGYSRMTPIEQQQIDQEIKLAKQLRDAAASGPLTEEDKEWLTA